jgi:hypothetical protein
MAGFIPRPSSEYFGSCFLFFLPKRIGKGSVSMSLKGQWVRFLKDDRGQSTTEYILILSVVVMIAMKFKKEFQERLLNVVSKLGTDIQDATNNSGY